MPPRFFVDAELALGMSLRLPDDAAHHALRVLRLRAGTALVLFNGRGGEYRATLSSANGHAWAAIEAFDAVERESPLSLTLMQALVAADKLDWIVEKAIELGVERVLVAPTRRSVVRLDAARAARRLDHWRGVARAACCQCGRNRVPVVDYCPSFAAMLAAAPSGARRLVLLPDARQPLPVVAPESSVALLVGPEGGLDSGEEELAGYAGFISTRLGPRILRTETAGIAAAAALQALGGDFAAQPR